MSAPKTSRFCILLLMLAGLCGCSQPVDRTSKAETTVQTTFPVQATTDATGAALQDANRSPTLPGITLFLDAGYLELDATVIGNGVEWLELVACTPGSREHEALVTVVATPSDLHFALLLLGVEPGQTQHGVETEDGWALLPATGGAVWLDFVVPGDGAEEPPRVTPAEEWVVDRRTGEALGERRWMFTGSRVFDDDGTPVYLADVNGTVASLVHFGDETLGRDTTLTQDADGQNLVSHPTALPPNGTAVKLRVTAVPEGG